MRTFACWTASTTLTFLMMQASAYSQESGSPGVKLKYGEHQWTVSARAQIQYLYNTDIAGDAAETNNGFRVRRGRFQIDGKVSKWIKTKFQVDLSSSGARLKDAIGQIGLGDYFYMRFGQFKVPVWREELRSSTNLHLIERSAAAGFLSDFNLSNRQIGFELGGGNDQVSWIVNISNGAGENGREDAGQDKAEFINNGKLVSGRVNVPMGDRIEVAVSGSVNRGGFETQITNTTGSLWVLAPDFKLVLASTEKKGLEFEGGIAFGRVDANIVSDNNDQRFRLFDVSGRWSSKLSRTAENLGGLDKVEFAAGITYIEPNTNNTDDEALFFRLGPAFYFGKQTRLQLNGEFEKPAADNADTILSFRGQINFLF